jgi:hypothetical protein
LDHGELKRLVSLFFVIPAKAGIQFVFGAKSMESGLRRDDEQRVQR